MRDDSRVPVRLQWLTIALMAVAGLAAERAFTLPDDSAAPGVACLAVLAALSFAVNYYLRCIDARPLSAQLLFTMLLALLAAPFCFADSPLEVKLLAAFRNLGFALAALSIWGLFVRLSGLASLFLVLFASCLALSPGISVVLSIYAAIASVWLMLVHWNTLCQESPHAAVALPTAALVLLLVVVGSVTAVSAYGPKRLAPVLLELMPTSGGTSRYDFNARGGVGDGEDQVAGETARSVGFVESDLYLEDRGPSLYDLVTDIYGPPHKPKEFQRMISLAGARVLPESNPAENLRPNREFSAVRKPPDSSKRPASLKTKALLFVFGPLPAHLRLTAYDQFDGAVLKEATFTDQEFDFRISAGSAWFASHIAGKHYCSEKAHYQLKIGHIGTERLPTPPQLWRFRLGRVQQANLFAWAQDGIMRLVDTKIPPGETLHAECGILDRRLVAGKDFDRVETTAAGDDAAANATSPLSPRRKGVGGDGANSQETLTDSPPAALPQGERGEKGCRIGHAVSNKIRALALAWAKDAPRGLPQVRAIEEMLRRHYQFDAAASTLVDRQSAIEHFLFEAKRGPDHLFAISAALLLRSLDYPTRVVNGFYADPRKLDKTGRYAPVFAHDMHFWTEVRLRNGNWMIVEPTPGYDILQPTPSLLERLVALAQAVAGRIADHWCGIAVTCTGLVVLWVMRRQLGNAAATLCWRLGRGRDRVAVVRTLRLLEFRCHCAGAPRPAAMTLSRWHGVLCQSGSADCRLLQPRLLQLADWALYAPQSQANPPDDIDLVCRSAVEIWTLRNLRLARACWKTRQSVGAMGFERLSHVRLP